MSNNHSLEYPEPSLRIIIGLGVDFDFTSFIFTILSVITLDHVILINLSILLIALGLVSWLSGVCSLRSAGSSHSLCFNFEKSHTLSTV